MDAQRFITENRNAMHHTYWLHPDDVKRIEAMKIPLNISPIFYTDWADGDRALQIATLLQRCGAFKWDSGSVAVHPASFARAAASFETRVLSFSFHPACS